VLVAESGNNRVQQLRIADGSWVRFVGQGVLESPQAVDCNPAVVAVVEGSPRHRVSVLSWVDGSALAQFGDCGKFKLRGPCGVRLLANGEVAIVDCVNDRLYVFTVDGNVVAASVKDEEPCFLRDVLECASNGSFVLVAHVGYRRVAFCEGGAATKICDRRGGGDYMIMGASALAALPDGGLVVRDDATIRAFRGLGLRVAWIAACVAATRPEHV
jgi:hypothetical protein